MIRLRVEKSPVRQFLAGLAGLVLLIAAIDIVWLHQLSGPPTTNTDGTLTSRGIVERRTDVLWMYYSVGHLVEAEDPRRFRTSLAIHALADR